MEAAAERLARAIGRRERVAIFGDYDVDGAASSALMKRFLTHYGLESEIYIPDRIFEGYGPNPEAMRELVARGASLIVTVDCGTNSGPSIAAANDAGADVVVIDHHQVGGPLPDAVAVVNPNREDDLSGQGHLCAAGVVFLVLVQTVKLLRQAGHPTPLPDLLGLLDLVALATVCDVVPLTGVNRAFVVKGLAVARRLGNPGLAALARVARIGEPLSPFHFSFLIGPRINAGGRIGDAALGSRLLATDDPTEAAAIAETLDRLNQERQAMENAMLEQARAEADAELARGPGPAILVTGSDEWHPGVVGLLASRLKDHARRPVFAIAFGADGTGTGSGRSIVGFDLGRLVREAAERGFIVKGGGHAMAAGITVERTRLGDLRAFFEEQAGTEVMRLNSEETLKIDAALSAEGATVELLDTLEHAGPYGAGHPAPILVLPRHRVTDIRIVGNGHMRVALRSEMGGSLQAMAFRAENTALGAFLAANREQTVHVAGTLSSNFWNGRRNAQFRIIDAAAVA
jgi:single-stranded-DNA-specific exonuclease